MTSLSRMPGVPPEISTDTSPIELVKITKANVLRVALIAGLGGLLYGYDTGVISGTLISISADFAIGHQVQEIVTAAILVGAVIGALGAGALASRIGRRRTILTVSAIFAIGAGCAALSPDPAALILSRLFLGLAVGGSTQTIPTYIAELAPREKRGRMVTVFNCAIGVGILAAALVGVVLSGVVSWRWMIAFAVAPAILLFVGMLGMPESPRWLVSKGHHSPARRVLQWVRPTRRAAERELTSIRKMDPGDDETSISEWAILRQPWVRPALVAGLSVAAFTQLTGLEMMIYYTPTILTGVGFAHEYALWANVGVGAVYLTMTYVGSRLVDRIGRRRLCLIMLPGAAISIALFGLLFVTGVGTHNPILAIALILLFMFFQSGGIQVIGWLLGSEVYPLSVRAAATSLHAMTLWGTNLLVTATALTLTTVLGLGGAMMLYAALNVVAWVVIFLRVPETRGRSLEDIEHSLRNGDFTPRTRMPFSRRPTRSRTPEPVRPRPDPSRAARSGCRQGHRTRSGT